MRGEEEGSEGKQRLTPKPLYAEATNIDKQRNKQKQAKSPDRSVIPLSHDKKRTIERPQCTVITVIRISHDKGTKWVDTY